MKTASWIIHGSAPSMSKHKPKCLGVVRPDSADHTVFQKPGNHPNFRKNALEAKRLFSELWETSGVFSEQLSEFKNNSRNGKSHSRNGLSRLENKYCNPGYLLGNRLQASHGSSALKKEIIGPEKGPMHTIKGNKAPKKDFPLISCFGASSGPSFSDLGPRVEGPTGTFF